MNKSQYLQLSKPSSLLIAGMLFLCATWQLSSAGWRNPPAVPS